MSDDGDCYEDSEVSCLDEFGWDPSVDAFLLEAVEEAPRYNDRIDFAWVSCTFLDTLAPTEDQLPAALDFFSPAALQVRWLYLQQRTDSSSGEGALGASDAACDVGASFSDSPDIACAAAGSEVAATAAGKHHEPLDSDNNVDIAGSGKFCSSSSSAGGVAGSSLPRKRGLPGRDRVLGAMQDFLFGRPRGTSAEKEQDPSDPSSSTSPAGSASASFAASSTWAQQQHTLEHAPAESLQVAAQAPEEITGSEEAHLAPDRAALEDDSACGCSNEALRCCLEELRWHGEALRRCATGEDAAALATEAASRRKALLWRLGLGPGGNLRDTSD